jgi:multiple sugar transport system substrate-binding protein
MRVPDPKLTRRRFLSHLAVAGAATLAVACGSDPGARLGTATAPTGASSVAPSRSAGVSAAAQASTVASAGAQGAVTFVNWEDFKNTPLEEVLLAFQTQSGRKVEIQPTPGTGTEYETKIRTILAGGAPPDIMRTNDDYVRYYSVKDQILDLSPYLKRDNINLDDYYKPIADFARQPDGKYTAWSLGSQPNVLYYNATMFKEAGVALPPKEYTDKDWKWDNFLEAAKKLTKGTERWGALLYDATAVEQMWTVNNGVADGIFSKDGKKFNLADPKGAAAIQWVADLTCKHQVQPERGLVSQPGVPNLGNNLFVAGKIGMILRAAGTTSYFRRNVPKSGQPGSFEWDIAPVPGQVDQKQEGSLICFTVTKAAKNPDGAWELLKFMGGPEGSKIFADKGYFVPAYKQNSTMKLGTEAPDNQPANIALFAKAMEFNTAINFTEATEAARNVYRPPLDGVWNCQAQAQEVFNKVKQEVEEVLGGKF